MLAVSIKIVSPPYITLLSTIFWRAFEALSSSIELGWNQCSFGISPYEVFEAVTSDVHLVGDSRTCLEDWENLLLELVVKGLLVEKDPRIVELLVEAVLHLLHALNNSSQIAIPCEDDKGRVCFSRAVRAGDGVVYGGGGFFDGIV